MNPRLSSFIFIGVFAGLFLSATATAQELGQRWGTAEREAEYYRLVDVPIPTNVVIEAGSFDRLPDGRLAIGTRRGELFLVDGAFDRHPRPRFQRIASGLDEILGLDYIEPAKAGDPGHYIVTQQGEVTQLEDRDGDGQIDRFKTLSDVWGFNNYHEFTVGSKVDAEGSTYVALCLSQSYHSKEKFRGWSLKITADGQCIPIASGIRSPLGIGDNGKGAMIYAESQGPWNGSCSLKHLKPGGFMGHPISFNWYEFAPEMGPVPTEPNSPSRLEIERKRVEQLVPYAVVFPYRRMGQSISGFVVDKSDGKFGPFGGQLFIGDYSLSIILRATMEEVNGVWQGACYPFREGLSIGILNLQFGPEGRLLAGGTNRGWPVRGARGNALERLDWTGKTPFEILEITARQNGFKIQFTQPVTKESAEDPASYRLGAFTHVYQKGYGSPEVDRSIPTVTEARLASDGMSVEIDVAGCVKGHVHEFDLAGLRNSQGEDLLHRHAFYTLNEIPVAAE